MKFFLLKTETFKAWFVHPAGSATLAGDSVSYPIVPQLNCLKVFTYLFFWSLERSLRILYIGVPNFPETPMSV